MGMNSILNQSLNALLCDADKVAYHAVRLAVASFEEDQKPVRSRSRKVLGRGAASAICDADASLGRLHGHSRGLMLEDGHRIVKCSGIELANELVHLAKTQRNFDANAKVLSAVDAMWDSILNLRV